MTIGIVRSLLTVILFAAFISLWIWAWSKRRHEDFTAAAQLPLEDEMQSSTRKDVT